MYGFLYGSLPNFLINTILMWVTSAFLEEFLFLGYLINRLMRMVGVQTIVVKLFVLILSGLIFGLPHWFQGTAGVYLRPEPLELSSV